MIPILYILGDGSYNDNDELRYSLRSVERYYPEVSRVIVVGENPEFLSDKVEMYEIEEQKGNKPNRINSKVEWACNNVVDGNFLEFSDDFFLTKTIEILPESKAYAKGCLFEHKGTNLPYKRLCSLTARYLKDRGLTTHSFEPHVPILYNSRKYAELSDFWHYLRYDRWGLLSRSIYGNIYGIEPVKYQDVKLDSLITDEDYKLLNLHASFSCSDNGWKHGVGDWLKKEFPNKSKYEL